MISLLLSQVVSAMPSADLEQRVEPARELLIQCREAGCTPTDGARAAWIVALHSYIASGTVDIQAVATVRALAPEQLDTLPAALREQRGPAMRWVDTPPPGPTCSAGWCWQGDLPAGASVESLEVMAGVPYVLLDDATIWTLDRRAWRPVPVTGEWSSEPLPPSGWLHATNGEAFGFHPHKGWMSLTRSFDDQSRTPDEDEDERLHAILHHVELPHPAPTAVQLDHDDLWIAGPGTRVRHWHDGIWDAWGNGLPVHYTSTWTRVDRAAAIGTTSSGRPWLALCDRNGCTGEAVASKQAEGWVAFDVERVWLEGEDVFVQGSQGVLERLKIGQWQPVEHRPRPQQVVTTVEEMPGWSSVEVGTRTYRFGRGIRWKDLETTRE